LGDVERLWTREVAVNAESFQKILMPYVWATILLVLVLAIAAFLIKRDGDREKAKEAHGPE
jgi:hypothetical protein